MRFYTNITRWGNHLLLREYVNGQRLNRRVKYSPTLFVPVQKQTDWKSLNGKNLMPFIIDAAKSYATMGEIVDSMKVVFGEWQENAIL